MNTHDEEQDDEVRRLCAEETRRLYTLDADSESDEEGER
jgi:hypothetical protein